MPYELYEQMVEAFKSNNDRLFAAAAINWIENVDENPFTDIELHQLFFNAKKYNRNWRRGGIDARSANRNMINICKNICAKNTENPYQKNEDTKKQKKKQTKQIKEEPKEEYFEKNEDIEIIQDIRYVMLAMAKAYNEGNEVNFQQFAVHLVDIATENPFEEGSEEYRVFAEMVRCYRKKPANIKRVHALAARLCEIINNTEVDKPKKVIADPPQKVLGIVPEEEKKDWHKFLHPWKKEGEAE